MSAVTPVQVEIGPELVCYITPFDAFRQLRLFGDLQKEILPAVGGVMNVAFGSDVNDEKTDAAAIQAFRALSGNFSGDQLEKWAGLLITADNVAFERDGGEPKKLSKAMYGEAFGADFSLVLELMYHVGKVNFADPLARWAGLSGLVLKLQDRLSASSGPTSKTS